MPREIITIQVGQCGNQIGLKFWELALKEHINKGLLFDDSMSSFFKNDSENNKNPILKARSLVVDTEEGVINQLQKSEIGALFDNKHFIKGVSGAGNNWAHGHYHYGPTYKESILDNINKLVEESDSPQCFMFTHSLGGGTGSGLGTYIIQTLNEYYQDIFKFSVTVFPSEDDDVITSPYNTMLALNELINNSDCVMPVDNESLIDICNRVEKDTRKEGGSNKDKVQLTKPSSILEAPKIIGGKLVKQIKSEETNSQLKEIGKSLISKAKDKPFDKMNAIIANLLCNFTCSMRFEGSLNVDINDITMNLVPYPRLHFLASSISPLYHVLDKKLEPRKVDQIFSDIFDRNYQLLSMSNYHNGKYLANALIARGDLSISDINHNLSKQKTKLKMVDWNSEGFKIGLCDYPPIGMRYGLLCLANTTSITDCFERIVDRFNRLYKVKAHVHHYTEYMSKDNFEGSLYNLQSLISEYNNIGYAKPKSTIKDLLQPIL